MQGKPASEKQRASHFLGVFLLITRSLYALPSIVVSGQGAETDQISQFRQAKRTPPFNRTRPTLSIQTSLPTRRIFERPEIILSLRCKSAG